MSTISKTINYTILTLSLLATLILVPLKLLSIIAWSWYIVLIPTYIIALYIIYIILALITLVIISFILVLLGIFVSIASNLEQNEKETKAKSKNRRAV